MNTEHTEYVEDFLIYMHRLKWNLSSKRLKFALAYAISNKNIDIPEVITHTSIKYNCSEQVLMLSLKREIQAIWSANADECSKLFYDSDNIQPCPSVVHFLQIFRTTYSGN